MGRSRLMQQQRARMEARRARLKKKKADMNKYGSGGTPAVTRDTSKGVSKQVLKYGSGAKKGVTRDTSKDTKPVAKKPTPKPAGVKPVKASKPSAQANKGSGRAGKFGTGTYGKGRPSDKKKDQPKSQTKQQGGLRSRSKKRAGSGTSVDVKKGLSNLAKTIDKKLKLTYKKGDTVKVGRNTFQWDGKRWNKLNTPF
jgi:hypothetical protein